MKTNFKYGDTVKVTKPGFYEKKIGILIEQTKVPIYDAERCGYLFNVKLTHTNVWFYEDEIKKCGFGELA